MGGPSILLATSNPAKAAKLRWLLDGLPLHPLTLDDVPPAAEPTEAGASHRDVASAKAAFWSRRVGGLALASDGGAVIPALGPSWSSLFTRRAAGAGADDRDRADHLLGLMAGRRGAERTVTWVEGLALASAGSVQASWEVECSLGRLVESYDPAWIAGGFWVWGLIVAPRFGKVFSQLRDDERAQLDDCWTKLRPLVRKYLRSAGFNA